MNRALTSDQQWTDHELVLNKANYALLEAALVAAGYEAKRYSVLEPYCQTDRIVLEKRKSCWVDYYLHAISLNVDLDTIPNISNCDLISSESTAVAGTFAMLQFTEGGNPSVLFTSKVRGTSGNLYSVEYVKPATTTATTTATIVGGAIKINLSVNGSAVITATESSVRNAVNLTASVANVISATGGGSALVTIHTAQNLSGGTN